MLQWTDHGGGKRDEGTGMYLGIPGWCSSGQTMVGEREMKDRDGLGDSWRVLQWTDHGGGKRDEGTGMDLGIPGWCCSGQTMVGEREMKEQGWTWGFLDEGTGGVAVDRPWWGKER